MEAMEECITRKRHELSTRQPSDTPTTDASPFLLSQLVMIMRAGDAQLPESTDNRRRSIGGPLRRGACSFFTCEGATASPDESSDSPGRVGAS